MRRRFLACFFVPFGVACAVVPDIYRAAGDASAGAGDGGGGGFDASSDTGAPSADASADAPGDVDASVPTYLFFATKTRFKGDFAKGLNARTKADSLCDEARTAAGLGGTWVAFMWTDPGLPPLNVTPFANKRVNFAQVTPGGAAGPVLLELSSSGSFTRSAAPILDEFGAPLSDASVWTGGSTTAKFYCAFWSQDVGNGVFGSASSLNWLEESASGDCGAAKSIYCMQTAP